MKSNVSTNFNRNKIDSSMKPEVEPAKTYEGIQRKGYWIGMVVLSLVSMLIGSTGSDGLAAVGSLIMLVGSFSLVISRLQNIGMSGLWSILILVPILNLIVGVTCLIAPEGYHDSKRLDTTAKVLGGIFLFMFSLIILAVVIPSFA